ncbi:MAG: hypothetical protein J5379_00445 [Clostridiales bacterium]|nr:hypothetical protein [Clostridiales bacterium]
MIEQVLFEICKENQQSRYINAQMAGKYVYLETATGTRGMYSQADIRNFRLDAEPVAEIFSRLDALKITEWPKSVPTGYWPGEKMSGCDVPSWMVDVKKRRSCRTHYIRGKGHYPQDAGYQELLELMDELIPTHDLKQWFENA